MRRAIPQLIVNERPDLVVIAHSRGYIGGLANDSGQLVEPGRQHATWQRGLERFAADLHAQGVGLLVLLDTPQYARDPLECAARKRAVAPCELTLDDAIDGAREFHASETSALRAAGHGQAIDSIPWICPHDRCPLVAPDGTVTYADTHHLTATYARSLADRLAPVLGRALAAPRG